MPKTTPAVMITLKRFTTTYDSFEDRIKIATEDAQGAPHVLWFTQRLLHQLVPTLVHCVGKLSIAEQPVQDMGAQFERSPQQKNAIQQFEQQSAQAVLKPEPRVQAPDHTPNAVIDEVSIALHPGGVALELKCTPNGLQFELTFNAMNLRQWLGILHKAYIQSHWPQHIWPDWIGQGDAQLNAPAEQPSRGHLH